MGRKRVRVASLSVGRVTACFRIGSPPFQSKPRNLDSIEAAQKTQFLSNSREDPNEFSAAGSPEDPDRQVKDHGVPAEVGNKIMVVVDSSLEAQGALEWALSHTVQGHDGITLLHVSKLSKQGSKGKGSLMAHELLYSMKNMCQMKRPGVQVEVTLLEGREKGPIIVEEARQQRVSLLVIGQGKQSSMLWSLMKRWAGNRNSGGVAEYCIQNASCMAIAVRRKSRKLGGYLITTKRHKNFWLLA
ncbi:hypothetical protein I3842_11G054500 [Carya illinoinensis]|uniref:UspA domain-containing protein n=1 Tax=Carya illinoinensis TaxID=32201 RepID=A0A922DMS9_CARIL|nr:hypothetical protein I3842_11G054500 [Carya illinoinensis]